MVREEEKGGEMYDALHIGLMSSDESDAEGDVAFLRRLFIVFAPYANRDIPTGLVIYIFSFRAYRYAFLSYGLVIF